jgi:hypothetical protein
MGDRPNRSGRVQLVRTIAVTACMCLWGAAWALKDSFQPTSGMDYVSLLAIMACIGILPFAAVGAMFGRARLGAVIGAACFAAFIGWALFAYAHADL